MQIMQIKNNKKYFSTISFPNPFLLDLLDFIKINKSNLRTLKICDIEFLGELIQSIGERCQKLKHLIHIRRNHISILLDGDKIFTKLIKSNITKKIKYYNF